GAVGYPCFRYRVRRADTGMACGKHRWLVFLSPGFTGAKSTGSKMEAGNNGIQAFCTVSGCRPVGTSGGSAKEEASRFPCGEKLADRLSHCISGSRGQPCDDQPEGKQPAGRRGHTGTW